MFYKIMAVSPLPNYELSVKFENGVKKKYDVNPLFKKWDDFNSLRTTKGLFEQVKVDVGGFGIVWNDDIDLACNELWANGTYIDG